MGFFDKVKNMFTEEVEDDDVKVEQIKKEVTKVTIESPKANNSVIDDFSEKDDVVFKPKENVPIFFDDNDFRDLNLDTKPKVSETKPKDKEIYKEVYKKEIKEKSETEEKKVFKPTPIISPVYGVLDKNYHKEDIVSRSDIKDKKNTSESPIDTIRNKAYGTLEDELENTLFGSNSILFKKSDDSKENEEIKEVDDDILTDLTDDISKELDELLIKKEKYVPNEENTVNDVDDEDLLGFIDSTLYKDGDE